MKKWLPLIVALALTSGSAMAQFDTGENSIGVFFDHPANTQNIKTPLAPFTPFNIYFVLSNPTIANIGGYEFAWRLYPQPAANNFFIMSTTWPVGQILNIGTNYDLICGCGAGYEWTGTAALLVTFNVMFGSPVPGETLIQVGPATPSSFNPVLFPDVPRPVPVFNDFTDPVHLAAMGYSTADVQVDEQFYPDDNDPGTTFDHFVVAGLARLGGEAGGSPTVTEGATWGDIKTLFR